MAEAESEVLVDDVEAEEEPEGEEASGEEGRVSWAPTLGVARSAEYAVTDVVEGFSVQKLRSLDPGEPVPAGWSEVGGWIGHVTLAEDCGPLGEACLKCCSRLGRAHHQDCDILVERSASRPRRVARTLDGLFESREAARHAAERDAERDASPQQRLF